MEQQLPQWLDLIRISEIGLLIVLFLQYLKTKSSVPSAWLWVIGLVLGPIVSYLAVAYQDQALTWVRIIFDGFVAAIMADVGYQFLSETGERFALPSKSNGIKRGG